MLMAHMLMLGIAYVIIGMLEENRTKEKHIPWLFGRTLMLACVVYKADLKTGLVELNCCDARQR